MNTLEVLCADLRVECLRIGRKKEEEEEKDGKIFSSNTCEPLSYLRPFLGKRDCDVISCHRPGSPPSPGFSGSNWSGRWQTLSEELRGKLKRRVVDFHRNEVMHLIPFFKYVLLVKMVEERFVSGRLVFEEAPRRLLFFRAVLFEARLLVMSHPLSATYALEMELAILSAANNLVNSVAIKGVNFEAETFM
ncbi:hypothetical protein CEXT_71651 [Caerostris extrusa]|uniref:Uncharacterized protein n=1 Tax=Caerostris extrusa TaxID=172846 RepID=A0AAV4XIU8_CAEEX|nr:hypothetical protein CEXT_71651 [Caerostris extrusa]